MQTLWFNKYKKWIQIQSTLANWRRAALVRQLMLVSLPHWEMQNQTFKKCKLHDSRNTKLKLKEIWSLLRNTKFSFYGWTQNLIVFSKAQKGKRSWIFFFFSRELSVGAVSSVRQSWFWSWSSSSKDLLVGWLVNLVGWLVIILVAWLLGVQFNQLGNPDPDPDLSSGPDHLLQDNGWLVGVSSAGLAER